VRIVEHKDVELLTVADKKKFTFVFHSTVLSICSVCKRFHYIRDRLPKPLARMCVSADVCMIFSAFVIGSQQQKSTAEDVTKPN